MSARDELQQWVEGTPNTVGVQVDGKIYYSMDVNLARRVLDEMDEQAGQAMLDVNAATHGQELIRQKAIEWRNERDAALAILAEVRAEHQPDGDYGYQSECVACGTQWPCTTSAILDRSKS